MASRKTEVRGLVGRPMLSLEHALFLRLRWGGLNFLFGFLGCWAWYCHKFLQKNDMFLQASHRRVDREIRAIFTQACTNVTRFIRSLEALIIIEKD